MQGHSRLRDLYEVLAAAQAGHADSPRSPSGHPVGRRSLVMSDEEREQIQSATAELWHQYKSTGDERLRERLILHYSPLVKYVAGRHALGLPPSIEPADLVSYGIFALIDAIHRFDPERMTDFEAFAISRINGAIMDELRSNDWIPRSVRLKAQEVEKAYAALEAKLPHTPTEAEVATELGIAVKDLNAIFSRLRLVNVDALDERLAPSKENSDGVALIDTLEDAKAVDPVQAVESEETKHLLMAAIMRLPEREKTVMTLYYYESLSFVEIANVMGLTSAGTEQVHDEAVLRLRGALADPSSIEDLSNAQARIGDDAYRLNDAERGLLVAALDGQAEVDAFLSSAKVSVLALSVVLQQVVEVWVAPVAADWLRSSNGHLLGASPLALLTSGESNEVLLALDAAAAFAFA